MKLIINLLGIFLIGFTYWFFLMRKESKAVNVSEEITIVVDGGYKPDIIKLKKGNPAVLKFYRKDESACLEEVVIPEFGIKQYLKLNKITEVHITPQKIGEFNFACGMNMFKGKIIVKDE